jgi:putative transposase
MGDTEFVRYVQRRKHQWARNARRHHWKAWQHLNGWKQQAHYDAANFLLWNWDIVIISTANPKKMSEKPDRPFGAATARMASAWAHYKFNQRLKSKARAFPGRVIAETDERHTTGTCGLCGTWNPNVGGDKTYRCCNAACGVHIDRDVNGARNILLRVFTLRQTGGVVQGTNG